MPFADGHHTTKEEQMKTRILVVLLALMMITAGTAMANTLADIVQRGELRVAVQSGAAPYAFVDKTADHEGTGRQRKDCSRCPRPEHGS